MADEQMVSPLPEDEGDGWDDGEEILDAIAFDEPASLFGFNLTVPVLGGGSATASRRPPSVSYFDILAGYSNNTQNDRRASYNAMVPPSPPAGAERKFSFPSPPVSSKPFTNRLTLRASMLRPLHTSSTPSLHKQQSLSSLAVPTLNSLVPDQRASWQVPSPTVKTKSPSLSPAVSPWERVEQSTSSMINLPAISVSDLGDATELASELERQDLEKRGEMASKGRSALLYPGSRIKRESLGDEHVVTITHKAAFGSNLETLQSKDPSILRVILECAPSIPHKSVLLLAFITAIGHGVATPLWSSYLSKLMALVAAGGRDNAGLARNSVIVLGLSLADGLCVGISFVAFEYVSYCWITLLRDRCFRLIMTQDKTWFDRPENSPATIVQSIIKDGDDMLPIVATIPGHFLTALVMIGVGTVWAAIVGWKLTLISTLR